MVAVSKKTPVNAALAKAGVKSPKKRTTPLWEGPSSEGSNGGVTFSLLSRFLVCRERFRIHVVEGLKVAEGFNAKMEFGNMWHGCEEKHAEGIAWQGHLEALARELMRKYPTDGEKINHWYGMCQAMFPLYAKHWQQHPDVLNREPLLQEAKFNIPYTLPSGRVVRLRGKWDSVDLIKDGKLTSIYIQENKSKSQIDAAKLTRQLSFDLQTMIYLVALQTEVGRLDDSTIKARCSYHKGKYRHFYPIAGVRYNVVRRSAHKSVESMLKKLTEDQESGRVGEWFARWKVDISQKDVDKFKRECLDPILENLCWWWEVIGKGKGASITFDSVPPCYWRHPYGVYNILDEGGSSDLDAYLEAGSRAGLQDNDNLFPELA